MNLLLFLQKNLTELEGLLAVQKLSNDQLIQFKELEVNQFKILILLLVIIKK
jgi:hypothetical protein